MTTKNSGPTIGIRQCADRAVTVTTNSPTAVVKQRESIVVRLSDGQQPAYFRGQTLRKDTPVLIVD